MGCELVSWWCEGKPVARRTARHYSLPMALVGNWIFNDSLFLDTKKTWLTQMVNVFSPTVAYQF